MQAISPVLSLSPNSPSFNSYSNSPNLAEIAARVVEEFSKESDGFDWDDGEFVRTSSGPSQQLEDSNNQDDHDREDEDQDKDDDEFEFPFVSKRADSSPISADEIFFNGQIRATYPLFNTDLLLNHDAALGYPYPASTTTTTATTTAPDNNSSTNSSHKKTTRRSPLRKLMNEERETTTSSCSSSSESEDLENLQPGTYCVWNPQNASSRRHNHNQESNTNGDTPERCKKSNSAGSNSKRWKFRDFLYRSNSDSFVSLSSSNSKKSSSSDRKVAADNHEINGQEHNIKEHETPTPTTAAVTAAVGKGDSEIKVKIVEAHYATRNRGGKDEDKRKSYLPYRQNLTGFFYNINGLSRNLHPF